MTTPAAAVPAVDHLRELGIAPLPPDAVACLCCGVAVPSPDPASLVEFARYDSGGKMPEVGSVAAEKLRIWFAKCEACTDRHALAERIIDGHPRLREQIGQRSIAVHRISVALDALAVLETPMSEAEASRLNDRQIVALIDTLAPVGSASRWASRFSPITAKGAQLDTAATVPFGHVDSTLLTEARYQVGRWLTQKREDLVTVAPPSLGGCTLCGVAVVTTPFYARERAWTPLSKAPIGWAAGHTCPPCTKAIEEAGGPGPTALRVAVFEAVDPGRALRRRWPSSRDPRMSGLSTWGAADRRHHPAHRTERFTHLPLDEIRRTLERADW